MPADIFNENDDNDEITGALPPLPLFAEPAVDTIPTADKWSGTIHSSPTLSREKPALEIDRDIADPITPTDIILTPRQQRVLRYLARRRMRNARIIKRSTHDNALKETSLNTETQPVHLVPEPAPATMTDNQGVTYAPITPVPADEPIASPVPAPAHTIPMPELPEKVPLLPAKDTSPTNPLTSEGHLPSRQAILPGGRAILPPSEVRPLQAQKIRQRRRVLRYFSRKHIRQARVGEYRARRHLWMTIGSTVLKEESSLPGSATALSVLNKSLLSNRSRSALATCFAAT